MPPYISFVRHGETEANRLHYLQSQAINEPLNKTGILQAKNLGKRLKDKGIGRMVISPSERTMETANFIMDAIAPPHFSGDINPDFLEINCGSLDGMPYDEIKQKYPGLYNAWWGSAYPFAKHKYPFPDGESFNRIVNRAKRAAEYLKSASEQKHTGNILVVGHGNMNPVIISQLLGFNPENFSSVLWFENCGLIKIDLNFYGRAKIIIS